MKDPLYEKLMPDYLPKDQNPRTKAAWISRSSDISPTKRASTVVHENTHEWVRDKTLEQTGQTKFIQEAIDPEVMKSHLEWKEHITNNRDPMKEMDKEKAYEGYLADPTEVHARIMELRKHYDIKPNDYISKDKAQSIFKDVLDGKTPVHSDFGLIFKHGITPFQSMFNKLWAVPAVGASSYLLKKDK